MQSRDFDPRENRDDSAQQHNPEVSLGPLMIEHAPERIFEYVVQRVRQDITQGKVKPGDRLRLDRELKRFGIGRNSVREAVRALELFGVVVVTRGRNGGVFFTPDCVELARGSFTQTAVNQPTLSDSLEFRIALEPMAAALAADRASDADIAAIRRSIQMLETDLGSAKLYAESNRIFHETVARAARNDYFYDCLSQLFNRPEVEASIAASGAVDRLLTRFFHARISDAIAKHDSEGAKFWMAGHLSQIQDDLTKAKLPNPVKSRRR